MRLALPCLGVLAVTASIHAATIQNFAGNGNGAKGFTGDGGDAKLATFNGPKGIAVAPNGNVFVADTENHVLRMIDVKRGTITVAAGTGAKGSGPAGGDPLVCALNRPHGVFVDADGAVFIGDTDTYFVRVIRVGK